MLAITFAALAPALRWLSAALSLTYLANLYEVYHLLGVSGFFGGSQFGGQFDNRLILVISAVNPFLFLVVLVAGLSLARRGETMQQFRIRFRWLIASAALVVLLVGLSLSTGRRWGTRRNRLRTPASDGPAGGRAVAGLAASVRSKPGRFLPRRSSTSSPVSFGSRSSRCSRSARPARR